MTATDPLNTTPWKPLDQDWGEGETVVIVHGRPDAPAGAGSEDESGPVRSPAPAPRPVREPARLIARDNADDFRTGAVGHMVDQTRAALDFLSLPKTGARSWARSLNYPADVTVELDEAVARIQHALDLIDIHENG